MSGDGTALGPAARRALDALTLPAGETGAFDYADLAGIGDVELGALLPAAYVSDSTVRFSIQSAAEERQVRFDPHSCARLFDALVQGLERRKGADLQLGLGALLRCTGPWPDELSAPARTLARFMLRQGRTDRPWALLGIAALAGPDVHRRAAARVGAELGPIAREELSMVSAWNVIGHALFAEQADRSRMSALAPLPDGWRRLADQGYATLARSYLEKAADRLDAVHAGKIPYKADNAFGSGEVGTLGRAARIALMRDEPWVPDLFDRILRGGVVAPTEAKTAPSQALVFELARAAQDFPTPEVAAAIRTARGIARHKGIVKQLDRQVKRVESALADRAEVALRLPDLGFDGDGTLRTPLGEHEAVISVGDGVDLNWFASGGKALRSVPAAVRRDHPGTVKDLRDLVKRVRAHLATLTRALEAGFSAETAMPCKEWHERLAAHPLAAPTARRLIWEFEVAPGEWRGAMPGAAGELVDATGASVPGFGGETPVRLWHPIRSDPGEIRAWRDLLVERRVRQPFKQAFREIYLLTPAEERTGHYSNRFAAHIVHYQRLFALFRGRGWSSGRLGPWDGGDADTAHKTLAGGAWRAAFHHDYVDGVEELASTDQVRIARHDGIGGWRDAPLSEVPAVVFSEAMRDVDLFVGVTSIAADPDWTDRGDDPHYDYWHRTGFGELTAGAETRRDALARILPRTKIADRCTLDGRFLIVGGGLRTYRIHLGSANVLMEPDDSYLCIVPDHAKSTGAGKVFLPFEDDRLSLILSKAFLLAADTAITDESILRQIRRGAR